MHLRVPIRSDKLAMSVEVSLVASVTTPFQTIDIYDSVAFGRMLLLDGHIQLTTLDEKAYHEALVQIPLVNVVLPKRALVVGGGDGGVIRELCRWPSIEHIDMVEIDEEVVRVCRKHLAKVSSGAFADPRVHLHVGDAFAFVREATHLYDLIVVDCTDVYEEDDGGLSEMLFTDEFYQDCRSCLSPSGFVITQADNLLYCPYSLQGIREAFERTFSNVGDYWAMVPSFGGFSGYCWASMGPTIASRFDDLLHLHKLTFEYLSPLTYDMAMRPLPFGSRLITP
ncbi:MAG: hypothetical protein K1X67_19075 [Fimbriimonadaceae bacterium]|nr:hypothetical protein [Fimbriimonadaceae bacterium]